MGTEQMNKKTNFWDRCFLRGSGSISCDLKKLIFVPPGPNTGHHHSLPCYTSSSTSCGRRVTWGSSSLQRRQCCSQFQGWVPLDRQDTTSCHWHGMTAYVYSSPAVCLCINILTFHTLLTLQFCFISVHTPKRQSIRLKAHLLVRKETSQSLNRNGLRPQQHVVITWCH